MLLRRLAKDHRLYLSKDETVASADPIFPLNDRLIRAFWVLLDFIDQDRISRSRYISGTHQLFCW